MDCFRLSTLLHLIAALHNRCITATADGCLVHSFMCYTCAFDCISLAEVGEGLKSQERGNTLATFVSLVRLQSAILWEGEIIL